MPVQHVGVRFHEDAGLGHFFFVRAQDLAQRANLLAHAVEHFAHRVHAHFAALIAVQRKADGQVFGKAQQHRVVGFQRGGLLGDGR